MRSLACLSVLLVVACTSGCSSKDKTPPPAPTIDPIETPTALTQVTIHGSAEPGSTIVMSGAAKFEPAEITADRFTALFHVVATLNPDATNKLSFRARDHAGNLSEATMLEVAQEIGHGVPAKLTLQLFKNGASQEAMDPIVLAAGDKIHALTQVQDAAGHVLDIPVAISTSIPNAFVAGPDISNIRAAGGFAIAATAAGSSLALSRDVMVEAGAATEITLDVSPGSVMAGTTVYVTAIAHDAFGNVVPDAKLQLTSTPALKTAYKPACATKSLTQGFLDAHRFVGCPRTARCRNRSTSHSRCRMAYSPRTCRSSAWRSTAPEIARRPIS